ncbi:hypothetical protein CYCD_26720 [Tenuifilaceae bacterium CYCD]|nr:hypothetical protein CYCD_26720 [Tenuifilaceae bacterium CYCD]
MIDLVKIKLLITTDELYRIVERNNLDQNILGDPCNLNSERKPRIIFDNTHNKRNEQIGYTIRVELDTLTLNIDFNPHKIHNKRKIGLLLNHNDFTMSMARQVIDYLSWAIGIDLYMSKVNYFEIGANLVVEKDPREYMGKMISIGRLKLDKDFMESSSFKPKRQFTTRKHKDNKVVYKVYDKVFEILDNNKDLDPEHPELKRNILRIETSYRRVENITLGELMNPPKVAKITHRFFSDWRTVDFEKTLIVPKGTSQIKINIAQSIYKKGITETLNREIERYKRGELSVKQLRNIKCFISKDWEGFKAQSKFLQSDVEKEFRKKLKIAENLLKD